MKKYLLVNKNNINMDDLKYFETTESYEAIKDSLEYPTVSYVKETNLVYFKDLYDWVDLGLSVKWASCNVGATSPEEYGLYFAWGETEGYTGITDDKQFNWCDYKYVDQSCYTSSCTSFKGGLTKYNQKSSSGETDTLTVLETSDDAAYITDSTCRMPTSGECQELINSCTSAWTTYNGVNGIQFTSNVEGYTDKSIFVPAAGYCGDGSLYSAGSYGYLWSSSLNSSSPSFAWYLDFYSSNVSMYSSNRRYGQSVRAVRP